MPLHIDLQQTEDLRDAVHRAVQALAEGKLVVLPTETVYGVAASALNERAVEQLKQLKTREASSPFALAVKSAEDALDYAPALPPLAARIARRCWPGPLTLVVDATHPDSVVHRLPPSVQSAVAPTGTVGLRVPADDFTLSVLRLIAGPLALTSANLPGNEPATSGRDALRELDDRVAIVVDAGSTRFAQNSTVAQVDGDGLRVLREGVITEAQMQRLSSFMVVLVCTGNTCRSPMAAGLMREQLAQRLTCQPSELEQRGVMVMSAGIAAMNGARASIEAVTTMSKLNIDISDHESQPLTERVVRFADLILTMTRGHRDAICAQWPEAAERVHLLCHDGRDVSDPIGGPESVYQQCATQIEAQLPDWIEQLDL
ncbi:MAG: threonylcarbamoyl-AMP synthase [Planctomycetales bacterium]|nr:threonylcarbamoyl-AMP synthase [Planctomycetales bacterium]